MQASNPQEKQELIYKLIEEQEKSVFGTDEKLSVLDKLTLDLVKFKANQISSKSLSDTNNKKKVIPTDLSNNSNFEENIFVNLDSQQIIVTIVALVLIA